MIDKEFARDQIKRLGGLDRYPLDKQAFNELVVALQTAGTESIARSVIDDLARDTECAKPGDIRRLILSKSEGEYQRPNWKTGALCEQCQSLGYFQNAELYVRCTCVNGIEFPQLLLDSMNRKKEDVKRIA